MKRTIAAVLFALLTPIAAAHAATVQRTLDNVVNGFYGGGFETITGFLDYDTVSKSVTAWNLQAVGGSVDSVTGVSGPIGGPAAGGNTGGGFSVSFGNLSSPDPLALILDNATGSLAGTSNLSVIGALFSNSTGPADSFIPLNGSLDYAGTVSPVPLPAALPLFGSGVIVLAGIAWTSRAKASQA